MSLFIFTKIVRKPEKSSKGPKRKWTLEGKLKSSFKLRKEEEKKFTTFVSELELIRALIDEPALCNVTA